MSDHRTDYLAKDYESFRQLMLDRLSASLPGWTERHPTDLGVTVVEAVAYAADRLSYYQDAMATEAYIGTARQRRSLRRHGRLIDYALHEGCNARAWVHVTVPEGPPVKLDLGKIEFRVSQKQDGSSPLADGRATFRPVHRGNVTFEHRFNVMDVTVPLVGGATSARLKHRAGGGGAPRPGDVFLLGTSDRAVTDANAYHPVILTRVIETTGSDWYVAWHEEDALPGAKAGLMAKLGSIAARGNNVLVDHGRLIENIGVTLDRRTRLGVLPVMRPDITYAEPPPDPTASASRQSTQSARSALPDVNLRSVAGVTYEPRLDLLASQATDRHFVLDWDEDRRAVLRFGDGACGALPASYEFVAGIRIGNGPEGNVAARVIDTITYEGEDKDDRVKALEVMNFLPAIGGMEAESSELMRLVAPGSIAAEQPRAVMASEYVRFALEVEGVQNAAALIVAEGARKVVAVAIDPIGYELARLDAGANSADQSGSWQSLRRLILHRLEAVRSLNHDVSVVAPRYVDIELSMELDVLPGHDTADLTAKAKLALGEYFSPDRLTFGTDVHWSQIVALLMRLPGIAGVTQLKFGRKGDAETGATVSTVSIAPLEIARYSNGSTNERR